MSDRGPATDAVLGFDIGTTSVKAGLFAFGSEDPMVGVVGRPYPSIREAAGWVEQDPRAWTAAMAACWAELNRSAGPINLLAVGICSQVNTHLITDASLAPLRNAIVWQDVRAASIAAELDGRVSDRRTALWGGPFTIDASFALSRLEWIRRKEPHVAAGACWLLSPKDYCVAALCGEVVTDTLSPIGLVGSDEAYLGGVLDLVPGSAGLLPPLRLFDAPAGLTRADNPAGLPAGIPVAVGTMDAWASVYGSGVVSRGQAMEVAGTSEILAVLSDRSIPTQGVITFRPVRGRVLHAGPTQAGGAALEWAARCFGITIPEFLALAAAGTLDPQPVLFLPHLAGERAPLWNPHARGVFLGLSVSTEMRNLALAVLEGVAFSARQALEACEHAAGIPATEVRLSGGGARSPLWNTIKATALGRPLDLLRTLDSSVLGAALMGAVAAGIENNLEEAAARHVVLAGRVEPDLAGMARLDHLYGLYREAYASLVDIFPKLGGVTS